MARKETADFGFRRVAASDHTRLVRDVFDAAQRERLVDTVSGALLGGVHGEVLDRAFWYWKSIDPETGARLEEKVRGASR